jgi:cytochrome P450
MLAAIGAGDLTEAEAAVQIVTLIIGASDTTRGALAVQVSLLAERGADWSDYGDNPELADTIESRIRESISGLVVA